MTSDQIRQRLLGVQTTVAEILADLPAAAPPASSVITDRVARPKPPLPTLGPAGFSFRDPTFGSRILRVTDDTTTGGRTSWRTSSASDNVWSPDGTKFFVENTGGGTRVFQFDPTTFTATDTGIDVPLIEPTWGDALPTLLFGRGQGERPVVQSFDLATKQLQVVIDLLTLVPEVATRPRTYLRGVQHAAGALCCIGGGEHQDLDDVAIYRPPAVTGAPVKIIHTVKQLGFFCHAAALDRTGRYVILGIAGTSTNMVWDTQRDVFTLITVAGGGHGAIGYGVSVNASNIGDSQEYRWRALATPNETRLVIPDLPTPAQSFASSHFSWNHVKPDNAQPFLVAAFRFSTGYAITPTTPWREWDDEIISVSVDGKTVRRHCHHRSDVRPDHLPPEDRRVGYWATPRPRTSPNGHWALFTSNWEKDLGADPRGAGDLSAWRQDVFLVELLP